ncbi:MAG: hypothetical protein AB7W37_13680 [Syntrophobacteraceae bacterium]
MKSRLVILSVFALAFAAWIYASMQPAGSKAVQTAKPEASSSNGANPSAERPIVGSSERAMAQHCVSPRMQTKTDASMTRDEMDRDFKEFIGEPDLPAEKLAKEAEIPTKHDRRQASRDFVIAEDTRNILAETYPVQEVQQRRNGEVWIQIGKENISKDEMEQIMADAANLQSHAVGSGAPVKVVLWSGRRAKAVRTFFGPQLF